MAIGHAPEIGAKFGGAFERDEHGWITHQSMLDFYHQWKLKVGETLVGGWGKLITPDRTEESVQRLQESGRYNGKIPQDPIPVSALYTIRER